VRNNYKYSKSKELKSGEVGWRCVEKTCKAKLYTIGAENNFSRESGTHEHENIDTNIIVRQTISNGIKRKGLDYITDRPSKLIKLEIAANAVAAKSILTRKDTKLIRDSIFRERTRQKRHPKSIAEVHEYIDNTKPMTVKGECFIVANDPLDNIIIFSCDTNLNFMCDSQTLYVDGTFKYSTTFFHRLLIIHAHRNGVFVPVVFCLLPNENKEIFTAIWEILHEKCRSLNKCLQPRTLVIDFQTSIYSHVKDIFPNISIIGCRFHLSLSWWRLIESVGLIREYENKKSKIGKWLRELFGLMFLDPNEVELYYENFLKNNQPKDERIKKIITYLDTTYIENDATFPPSIWAKQEIMLESRDDCKSLHDKLGDKFTSVHPNIAVFMKNVLAVQTDSYVQMNAADNNESEII
ncbi:hypothetical protein AGLY_006169, partial [Aphis glycines]